MGHLLSRRRRLWSFLRTSAVARRPIIFDLRAGRAYRAASPKDLAEVMKKAVTKRRVVKTVEGLPPHVLEPQKK
jgi:hypothetical protein